MIIHRFWMGDPDPTADVSGRRLLELNPGATLIVWSPTSVPGDVLELVASSAEWVVPAHWRRHAGNVVRLWALHEFGGVWVDHDVTVYAPFSVMPSPASAAHHGGGRCNCWLQFPKGHPALAQALDAIAGSVVVEERGEVFDVPGRGGEQPAVKGQVAVGEGTSQFGSEERLGLVDHVGCGVIHGASVPPPRSSTVVSGEHLLERLWGDDVERVRVRRDIDGRVDAGAPCWFDHAGRTARAA